jgi:uncharacterized protein (DUF1330 family)
MRIAHIGTLLIAVGIAVGIGSVPAAHAQSKSPMYVINQIEVTDQAVFKGYADRQEVLIKKHGGRFIVRGGSVIAMEGMAPKRLTEYVFEDAEHFTAWQNEPEQKELSSIRDKASKFNSFAVEGLVQ